MSNHEDLLEISGPITVDESAGRQDDDIPLTGVPALISSLYGDYGDYGEPANLAYRQDMISTQEGVTEIGWADQHGDPISDLDTSLFALDPESGNYEPVTLNVADGDDNVLIGTTASGNVAFVAVIVPNADGTASDVYLLDYLPKQHANGDHADDTAVLDELSVAVTGTGLQPFDFGGAPAGQNAFMAFGDPDGLSIVVTGTAEGQTVNSSKANDTSLGANNQNVDAGEGLVVTYVSGMDSNYLVPDLTSTEAKDAGNIQFDSLQTATVASVQLVKFTPPKAESVVHITALLTGQEEGTDFIPGITDGDPTVPITAVFVNGVAWDFTTDGDTVVIEGVKNNDTITFQTEGDHNRFIVENGQPEKGAGSNVSWNIGGIAVGAPTEESDYAPITLQFDDDGPMLDVIRTDTEAPSLTTQDADTIGDDSDTESDDFSVLFELTQDMGADDNGTPASLAYSLSIGDGMADTGLASDGNSITLVMDNGDIVGQTTVGDVVTDIFRIGVDKTVGNEGRVTLTQYAEIDHTDELADGIATNNSVANLGLAPASVRLTASATIVDGDNDRASDSETVDIGDRLSFDDDLPALSPIDDGVVAFEADDFYEDDAFLDYGADGRGSFVITGYTDLPGDTDLGQITETLSEGDTVLTYSNADGPLFRLTLDQDADGGYRFEVLQGPPQVPGGESGTRPWEGDLTLEFDVRAFDGDDDAIDGSFQVFIDGTPEGGGEGEGEGGDGEGGDGEGGGGEGGETGEGGEGGGETPLPPIEEGLL